MRTVLLVAVWVESANVTRISRITRISGGARHLETGTEDVSDEVDKLEREGPRPKKAVSAHKCEKQEMLLYQRPTRPEESSQIVAGLVKSKRTILPPAVMA